MMKLDLFKDGLTHSTQSMCYTIIIKGKTKNNMMTSTEIGKESDKIQHPFMIKTIIKWT